MDLELAFFLVNQGELKPSELGDILDRTCGERPTVLLVSACYSGIFSDFDGLATDKRVILTAARADRTSFGCGAENQYTYWDGCLLDEIDQAKGWDDLFSRVNQCILRKEAGMQTPSVPQKHIGSEVETLPYLSKN